MSKKSDSEKEYELYKHKDGDLYVKLTETDYVTESGNKIKLVEYSPLCNRSQEFVRTKEHFNSSFSYIHSVIRSFIQK